MFKIFLNCRKGIRIQRKFLFRYYEIYSDKLFEYKKRFKKEKFYFLINSLF